MFPSLKKSDLAQKCLNFLWSDIRWKLCIRNRLWNESHFRPRNKSSKNITPVLPRGAGGLRGCFNGIKCILWYSTQYLTIGISYHCSIPNAIYPRLQEPRNREERGTKKHFKDFGSGGQRAKIFYGQFCNYLCSSMLLVIYHAERNAIKSFLDS